jgi:pimeloyl-ACP methyl ester carboxylesterase
LTYLTFATEDGRRLSYQRRGSGPLVVCIPGGPGMDPEAYFAETFADGADRLAAAADADDALGGELDEAERRRQYRRLMAGYVAELGPAEVGYLDRLCAAPVNWEPVFEMSKEFVAGLDLLAGAQAVVAPVLAIGCEFDVTVPASAMHLIAEALPNGRFLELARVGHPSPRNGHRVPRRSTGRGRRLKESGS